MTKIQEAFKNKKAFIPFITAGDPNLEVTKELVIAMEKAGADIVELGIPFSDPTAEGPVIQEANLRALSQGVTTDKIFEMVRELRTEVQIPLVFMTYANVVFAYGGNQSAARKVKEEGTDALSQSDANGIEAFVKKMAEVGMNGLILPDVPFEEKEEFTSVCKKYGIEFISLIAPTSENRIARIAADAEGFVYVVSSLGVTGTRTKITTDIKAVVEQIKRANPAIPCAIGFGISNAEQVKKMSQLSDGAIVGSAIVKIIAAHGADCVPYVAEFVKEMKAAQREL